jgi:hypothetical protein
MIFAIVRGHRSGRATPSLRDAPERQFTLTTGRGSTCRERNAVQTKPATSSFHSIVNLQTAIKQYLAERNAEPRPFIWTASAASILAKIARLPVPSE